MALYELVDQHRALEALTDSDELPPEVIRDTLEGLVGELEDKAISVARFIRNVESMADTIDDAARLMMERATRLRRRSQSVRDYLLFNMQAVAKTKIECPHFTLSVRTNPPTVIIDDVAAVPAEFMVTPPTPPPRLSLQAIAGAFKEGQPVPGCHIERRQRLEIKG